MPVIALITSILSAVAADIPVISELLKLLEGPFSGKRAPTEAEWDQLRALADKAHAEVQAYHV